LPPVVVGLVLYLALSRSGPLGFLELLYTPSAMVIAQAILALPIMTAFVHRASERAWASYGDELISDGASRAQALSQILRIVHSDLLTAILAGFGRTISEVGAVILVGGNIPRLHQRRSKAFGLLAQIHSEKRNIGPCCCSRQRQGARYRAAAMPTCCWCTTRASIG